MSLKESADELISKSVRNDVRLCDDDTIRNTSFTSDGKAKARVYFNGCLCSSQIREIRQSDTWQIQSVHKAEHHSEEVDGVDVHLIETLE